jgi:DNA gyrase/topoisomerase IV subunit A
MNMVALVDGQPRLLNLKQMLECFLRHRREVLTRRTVFELRKARERAHIQEGLAVALDNVDEIIALIKASPTPADARRGLMARLWTVADGRPRCCSVRSTPRVRKGWALNTGCRQKWLSALRSAGAGDPRTATAATDRSRTRQDRRRLRRTAGAHRRPDGHPGATGAHHRDDRRGADRDPRPVR